MRQTASIIIKTIIILVLVGYLMLLFGCAKTPIESATDASLGQVNDLEQQIKKDCPTVNYDKKLDSLRNSIKTQLSTCESQMGQLKERNNTLWAVLIGLIGLIVTLNISKIKRIF